MYSIHTAGHWIHRGREPRPISSLTIGESSPAHKRGLESAGGERSAPLGWRPALDGERLLVESEKLFPSDGSIKNYGSTRREGTSGLTRWSGRAARSGTHHAADQPRARRKRQGQR